MTEAEIMENMEKQWEEMTVGELLKEITEKQVRVTISSGLDFFGKKYMTIKAEPIVEKKKKKK